MSIKHPIIAATGSSGAGTTSVKTAFEHIFGRLELRAAVVEGDSFHAYDRVNMNQKIQESAIRGENFSHFGPGANHLDKLNDLFKTYSKSGTGQFRRYVHTAEEAMSLGKKPGTFTPWEPLPNNTDLMLYEGLHGGIVTDQYDLTQHVDLLIGIVPIVNLEWTQKVIRDTTQRGYALADVQANILRRMPDYLRYIVPQFSRTDINFQRIPTIDTANPFNATEIPAHEESFVVIHFREPKKFDIDFPYLLTMLHDSFMSRADTIVVPGGKLPLAIELIFTPLVERIMQERWEFFTDNDD